MVHFILSWPHAIESSLIPPDLILPTISRMWYPVLPLCSRHVLIGCVETDFIISDTHGEFQVQERILGRTACKGTRYFLFYTLMCDVSDKLFVNNFSPPCTSCTVNTSAKSNKATEYLLSLLVHFIFTRRGKVPEHCGLVRGGHLHQCRHTRLQNTLHRWV